MLMFQNEYQPILALFLPVAKKLNTKIHNKWIREPSCGDKTGSTLIAIYNIGIHHTVFISYAMGSIATYASAWFIMGFTFANNIHTCLSLVVLKKRNPGNINKQIFLLQKLALAELVEFVAPLAFLLPFVIGYYGPNSKLIGNLGSNYFHFRAVEDLSLIHI